MILTGTLRNGTAVENRIPTKGRRPRSPIRVKAGAQVGVGAEPVRERSADDVGALE
jgi:hypothetical protein